MRRTGKRRYIPRPNGRKKRRRYSDNDRAEALAALASNGGNLTLTAHLLGVPYQTLKQWSNGSAHPAVYKLSAGKRAELADMLRGFVDRVLRLTTDWDIKKATLSQRFTAAGIAVDKSQLLGGEATAITANADISDNDAVEKLTNLARRIQARRLQQGAIINGRVITGNDGQSAGLPSPESALTDGRGAEGTEGTADGHEA